MDRRRIDDAARDPRLMRGEPIIATAPAPVVARPMRGRSALSILGLGVALLAAPIAPPPPAWAAPPENAPPARMVVEARELVNDENKDTVTANGDVQIYYNGRFLRADHVVYDRKTGRVFAQGHATLTERDGSVIHAERFDFTDDFKNGFIESLQADTPDNTHFSAPRGERSGGDSMVFDKGSYTACDACKNDPTKPRMWQLNAKRIIRDEVEKVIYYEDATFELLGTPIAYFPFLSGPDPTKKRQTGFLVPELNYGVNTLGLGVGLPFFWEIAPDADLTITPTYFTKQGPFLTGEFRQRFETGNYMIHLEGTHVGDRSVFPQPPAGAGDRSWRGEARSTGQFTINDQWKYGWDVTALSDRYFLQDYKRYVGLNENFFFRESSSTAYLTGQGDRSYFDMRGFYFQALSPNDVQKQQPITHPITDYNRVFDIDPAKAFGLGGQLEVDANFTSTSASIANYESVQPRTLDAVYGLYTVCQIYSPAADPYKSNCLLRGIGGDYQHATASAAWKEKFIDPIGGVWTPFAFARFFGSYLDYNQTGAFPAYNNLAQPIPNGAQSLFVKSDQTFRGQALPGFGAEWRFPLLARVGEFGSLVIEPIGQVVARPNQSSVPSLVNMDAQSLVFDDTNLFEWSKFSGYDRYETGTRLNYGGQASMTFANGAFANALLGQSVQIAGVNSYSTADAANVGLSSGLDTRASDIVGRFAFAPAPNIAFVAKGRFDKDSLQARRLDLAASWRLDPLTLNVQYANYASQPVIGFDVRRQGLSADGRYDITKNYFVNANVTFDMSRYLYNALSTYETVTVTNPFTGGFLTGTAPVFSIAQIGFGAGYHDECMTATLRYSSFYQPEVNTGQPARNQTFLLTLQFRTLGDVKFGEGLSSIPIHDGVRAMP
jgi:LPS-assembly protein